MNADINFIAGRIAGRPMRSFLFKQRFACFSTGVYRSSCIFIQSYFLKIFQLGYILIKYYSRAIYCRYTIIFLLLQEKK